MRASFARSPANTAVSARCSRDGHSPTKSACSICSKRGSRLGGATGQMLLRFLGWDGFTMSKDVVACLRDAGLDIREDVKSKRDLTAVQAQFNAWAAETGLPYAHLSRICAMSTGENYEPSRLASIASAES